MRSLRLVVRLGLIGLGTISIFVLWLLGRLATLGRERWSVRWRAWIYGRWARWMCHVVGARLVVRGELPPAPCLLVSNHLGYVDIPVLASRIGAVFVSKAEVAGWPVIGYLARTFGTIFVKRQAKRDLPRANALIEAALDRGERVVLFPEGTSSGGDAVGPFKPSLLEPAARSRYPVYCAALRYRTSPNEAPASEIVSWWRDMEFTPHVLELLRTPYFDANLEFAPQAIQGTDRKDLAERTWQAVSRMHKSLP